MEVKDGLGNTIRKGDYVKYYKEGMWTDSIRKDREYRIIEVNTDYSEIVLELHEDEDFGWTPKVGGKTFIPDYEEGKLYWYINPKCMQKIVVGICRDCVSNCMTEDLKECPFYEKREK